MKTPEKIKRGLDGCAKMIQNIVGCAASCPYWDEKSGCGSDYLMRDALAYIQQLEWERNTLINIVKQTRFACWNCKYHVGGCTRRVEEISLKGDCFEWRGVEEDDQ